jgi:AcrR family transcriptional regulator
MMHRARKEAILEECTRLLSERGYDAMTLDQVAEAAGMAKAVLYKHFKGKEDLCCEVMVRGLERAQGSWTACPPAWWPVSGCRPLCAGCCRPS